MKKEKRYLICQHRVSHYSLTSKKKHIVGTLGELTDYFSYTLECGKSWESRTGCRKINLHPRQINSLINNVNAANNNVCKHEWVEFIKEVPSDYVLEDEYKA